MASRKRRASEALPSDPQVLLDYFDALPSDDSCSDSEFDGYIEDFNDDYFDAAKNDSKLLAIITPVYTLYRSVQSTFTSCRKHYKHS